eukprot:m.72352 g.72352  ORF g.72352 m.72352 type:complete len:416 (+) comp12332_c0_seq1:169-1416(+)
MRLFKEALQQANRWCAAIHTQLPRQRTSALVNHHTFRCASATSSHHDSGSAFSLEADREQNPLTESTVLPGMQNESQIDTQLCATFDDLCSTLEEIYHTLQRTPIQGEPASYIPELKNVDTTQFGISATCCKTGRTWNIGNSSEKFTMQSAAKPLLYSRALALTQHKVHDFVGYEPSGQAFNAFVLDANFKPHNPMINGGALVISSLLLHELGSKTAAYKAIVDHTESAANNKITYNNRVCLSELEHGDRNTALMHFIREHQDDLRTLTQTRLSDVLTVYCSACSLEVTTDDLASIAATYANYGVNPITAKRVMQADHARATMSLMYNCGMYDYSGRFAFRVGLPAKSAVSGALFISVPNTFGIGVWAPPLDKIGNSVRGVSVAEMLVATHPNLHMFAQNTCLAATSGYDSIVPH